MKKVLLLMLVFTQYTFANEIVWGKTGHRVVGEVAQELISSKTRKAINKILDGQTLAEISTYADEIKSDRAYDAYSPWHYVNYPFNLVYSEVTPAPEGDLVMGIQNSIQVLKDPERTKEEKAFYLKMLVHLLGDLHQPLHAGRGEDKGGNDIQVMWFGKGSNLHRVWDSHMIDDYGMSYTELSNTLPKISKKERKAMQKGNVLQWVEETQELAEQVYGTAESGDKLGYSYSYKHWDLVEKQLLTGGVRLASVLDSIFD
ncbi:S1/P1 nuclease [Zeaxanthinibacter enoshimensis]|uniref:S1/P1 nuclease n=1 Tax=Zeaxanthinibacter enoshimensis TaxID=392009 RepID=A0A4R6TK89_9FLAO|nr:S1/P1 nuclease [Zeaxanthinibacter enoshimensis]TDQ30842.1 S1/P1 nuclease [Zeaxanthinibacter enoshimensis]